MKQYRFGGAVITEPMTFSEHAAMALRVANEIFYILRHSSLDRAGNEVAAAKLAIARELAGHAKESASMAYEDCVPSVMSPEAFRERGSNAISKCLRALELIAEAADLVGMTNPVQHSFLLRDVRRQD